MLSAMLAKLYPTIWDPFSSSSTIPSWPPASSVGKELLATPVDPRPPRFASDLPRPLRQPFPAAVHRILNQCSSNWSCHLCFHDHLCFQLHSGEEAGTHRGVICHHGQEVSHHRRDLHRIVGTSCTCHGMGSCRPGNWGPSWGVAADTTVPGKKGWSWRRQRQNLPKTKLPERSILGTHPCWTGIASSGDGVRRSRASGNGAGRSCKDQMTSNMTFEHRTLMKNADRNLIHSSTQFYILFHNTLLTHEKNYNSGLRSSELCLHIGAKLKQILHIEHKNGKKRDKCYVTA
jgi:hypothetical protein